MRWQGASTQAYWGYVEEEQRWQASQVKVNRTPTGPAAVFLFLICAAARGGETELGGDLRYYQFVFSEATAGSDHHFEQGILRGKLLSFLNDGLRLEVHAGVQLGSATAATGATSIVTGTTPRFFDLEAEIEVADQVQGLAELDRLNLRWDRTAFRLVVGRQAVTWGVNFFWPVLDLFAPFAPQRIDRDYKPGVDAVRLTLPAGDFSEVEIVAAGQGERLPQDFSLASLGRFHTGRVDLGFMAGHFHEDWVAGGFVTADLAGTGVRGEVAFTDSSPTGGPVPDPVGSDSTTLDPESFWRATVGVDGLLTPSLTLTAEGSWNGFGARDPSDYPQIARSRRVRRGEVSSLGRLYGGVSLAWLAHPLWTVAASVLTNWQDGSTLVQPTAEWSVSDNMTTLFGASVGLGPGRGGEGQVRSEYGLVPLTVWGAVKWFF